MTNEIKNHWPNLFNGDVHIGISSTQSYKLHSPTLRSMSSYFDKLLSGDPPKLTARARRENHTPWRLQLTNDDSNPFINIVSLLHCTSFLTVQLITESGTIPKDHRHPLPPSTASGKYWDWLFCSFYSIQPPFSDETFGSIFVRCSNVLALAKSIGSVHAINHHIELALKHKESVLWESVAREPVEWADISYDIQSASIFKEAVTHIVGQYHTLELGMLNKEILALCEMKYLALERTKTVVNVRLAGHYPDALSVRNFGRRIDHAAGIYDWQAVCFFRQWLVQTMYCQKYADDGGYAWYKTIAGGGEAYLDHEARKEFHRKFPSKKRGETALNVRLTRLKDEVKVLVGGLVRNNTHVDVEEIAGQDRLPWLTCVEVKDSELPWFAARVNERGALRRTGSLMDVDGREDAGADNLDEDDFSETDGLDDGGKPTDEEADDDDDDDEEDLDEED